MELNQIYETLKLVTERLQEEEDISWRLLGSARLKMGEIDTKVNDVDFTTNKGGLEVFRRVLQEYPVEETECWRTGEPSLRYSIGEMKIHICSDKKLLFFDQIEVMTWEGIEVPVLPLEVERKFYELLGRHEKAAIITAFLQDDYQQN